MSAQYGPGILALFPTETLKFSGSEISNTKIHGMSNIDFELLLRYLKSEKGDFLCGISRAVGTWLKTSMIGIVLEEPRLVLELTALDVIGGFQDQSEHLVELFQDAYL
jgi:hypothetical protein